ncbi:MAG: hypothetical protein P8X58_14365 [Syntrophobacterales bacterium]
MRRGWRFHFSRYYLEKSRKKFDRTLLGTVEFVAFKADPATKTFLVRSVIDNPDHDIRPGMSVVLGGFLRRRGRDKFGR